MAECPGKGKGRGRHGGRGGRGGRGERTGFGSREGRDIGRGQDFRGQDAPWLRERPVPMDPANQADRFERPEKVRELPQEMKGQAPAAAPLVQAGECPFCENHCPLDDPACGKGKAYASSLHKGQ